MEQEVYLKIKEIRKKRGLTLKEVSEQTGLAISFLSQMERGKSPITLVSLKKIANVLEFPMKELFAEPDIEEEYVHSNSAHMLEGLRRNYDELSVLSGKFPDRKIDCFKMKIAPHTTDLEETSHSGEEFYYVLKGEATVFIDGQKYSVKAGESIHFPSFHLHTITNEEDEELELLSAITPTLF